MNGWRLFCWILLLSVGVARGALTFTPVTWETPGNAEGWVLAGPDEDQVAQSSASLGGNTGGYLAMTFTDPGAPTIEQGSMVNATSFSDDYTLYPGLTLTFDLYTDPGVLTQTLYLDSTYGGGSVWAYTLTGSAGAWMTQTVPLDGSAGWAPVSGTGSFADALSEVTVLGMTFQTFNSGSDVLYGVDNWSFTRRGAGVPEPSSLAFGVVALGSALAMCRRRLAEFAAPPTPECAERHS